MSPLSFIYSAITEFRNGLYDRQVLKPDRLSRPVISVGNLSVGGSGKTPFVILLGELLKSRNIQFDVLSRGYGRRTRGVLVVNPNGSPDDFGDEPLLIARRLECPVIVGESRYQAGLLAERRFPVQVHVLDDGFQHRSLARDFDIVMLAPEDVRDRLLPAGRLREPLSLLHRADAIVLTGHIESKDLPISGKLLWKVQRGISVADAPQTPVVFCGIARPKAFLDQLHALGIRESVFKSYRDHHHYSERDIGELRALKDKHRAHGFITTEKDIINLEPHVAQLSPIAIARVTMAIDQPDAALDTLLRVLAKRAPVP